MFGPLDDDENEAAAVGPRYLYPARVSRATDDLAADRDFILGTLGGRWLARHSAPSQQWSGGDDGGGFAVFEAFSFAPVNAGAFTQLHFVLRPQTATLLHDDASADRNNSTDGSGTVSSREPAPSPPQLMTVSELRRLKRASFLSTQRAARPPAGAGRQSAGANETTVAGANETEGTTDAGADAGSVSETEAGDGSATSGGDGGRFNPLCGYSAWYDHRVALDFAETVDLALVCGVPCCVASR